MFAYFSSQTIEEFSVIIILYYAQLAANEYIINTKYKLYELY